MNYHQTISVKKYVGIFSFVYLSLTIFGSMILHILGINLVDSTWFACVGAIVASYLFVRKYGRAFNSTEYRNILIGSILVEAVWGTLLLILIIIGKHSTLYVTLLTMLGTAPDPIEKFCALVDRGTFLIVVGAFIIAIVFVVCIDALVLAFMYSSIVVRHYIKKGANNKDSYELQTSKEITFDDRNIDTNSNITKYILYLLGIVLLILTYALPDNVLDSLQALNKYVDFMSSVFPSVANYGKYSEFPQVAQLVYSIGITSVPFFVISLFFILNKKDEFIELLLNRPIKTHLTLLLSFMLMAWALIYFPPNPDPHRMTMSFALKLIYKSRLLFATISVSIFTGTVFSATLLLIFIKNLSKIVRKYFN